MDAIIASTSTVYGSEYLEYLKKPLSKLFKNTDEILFVPFARPGGIDHNEYTEIAKKGLAFLNKKVIGLHQKKDPEKAIAEAKAIFTGGGNTFLLVKNLHENQLMEPLKNAIKKGTPYMGTSAGSNICGPSMQTTNDMPIVQPPNFKTLGILTFNINAHYLDADPNSKHKGETRETRIKEYHVFNKTPVLGLREGSWLEAKNGDIILKGEHQAHVFEPGESPYEIVPETSLKNLS